MQLDLGETATITLGDGTVLRINEKYGLIWIHPKGEPAEGSFRVNLKVKMVDVLQGADWRGLTQVQLAEGGKNEI